MIVNVADFGILGDGVTNYTERLNALIQSMDKGGMLFFPPGEYVTGSLKLRSNMTVFICTGATLLGSLEKETDFPYNEDAAAIGFTRDGRHALLSAFREKNIIIEGGGTIDARGAVWWQNPEDTQRPRTIQMILCENIKIKNITIKNSPIWTVHPVCCKNVCIDDITIINPPDSPNTDGINPESCSNVRISNCTVDVGDDCITLKAGTEDDELQKQFPCENIVITNCTLMNGHGGIVIGSEMSGGVKNVVVSNCIFNGTDRGVRIKTRRKRGGIVKDLMFSNLFMTDVFVAFTMNTFYYCGADMEDSYLFGHQTEAVTKQTPVIQNVSLCNISVQRAAAAAMYLQGLPEMPIKQISVRNMKVHTAVNPDVCFAPIMMPGLEKMQARGIFIDNVADSVFEQIELDVEKGEPLNVEHVENVSFNGKKISNKK